MDREEYEYGKWLAHPPPGEEIVITGLSGRYPESDNVHAFRDNLFSKLNMSTTDGRRWPLDYYSQSFAKINDMDSFDAGFFGVHHRQADNMEPVMRKVLEHTIEAIIDAGVNPLELQGTKTGVFAGACFAEVQAEVLQNITEEQKFAITGHVRSMLTTRISYFLKVKGPSVVLDSACSSSLAALEIALKEIRSGRCDNAVVFGGGFFVHPKLMMCFERLGLLSPDGKCRPFDQDANGYLRAEAVTSIFLQKKKNARRIYAQVIYGKSNSDGYKDTSITSPSVRAQQLLMTEILRDTGISPSSLSYLEAHGTGTKVGDPIETQAIDNAIGKKRNKPLLVGTVKSNIGHGESVSGLCALTKIIIAMETGLIPPNINFKKLRKGLKAFEDGRLKLVTEPTKLEDNEAIVGINNFGFGGGNTHVVLKRWGKLKKTQSKEDRLVCVSGRTEEGVLNLLDDLQEKFDHEYVGLVHQVFKNEVLGHRYRGFTVVSQNKTSPSVKLHLRDKPKVVVYFGDFLENHRSVAQHLMQFLPFRTAIEKITKSTEELLFIEQSSVFGAVAVQIAITHLLTALDAKFEAFCGNHLISAYCNNEVSLKDLLRLLSNNGIKSGTENVTTYLKNCIVLNISDKPVVGVNNWMLKEDNFLEILGKLYQEGYNLQIHNLYEPIKFPVSRGTPMMSPFLTWNHSKKWHSYKFDQFGGSEAWEKIFHIPKIIDKDQKYLEGHVVDGVNLLPATEFLNIVWKAFAFFLKTLQNNLPVVFEDCKFVKALPLGMKKIKLLVSVQKGSGRFEVVDLDNMELLVTGRIFAPDEIRRYQTELPDLAKSKTFLGKNDIYREFNIRGYNYNGGFKNLLQCSSDGTDGVVQWNNNWTTFLDNVLQVKILQTDVRSLFVPIGFKRISIDPEQHLSQKEKTFSVRAYKDCNIIKSGGVEISGLEVTAIHRRAPRTPILEKHIFVPNTTKITTEQSVRVVTDFILENTLETKFKAVEIYDNKTLILPMVKEVLEDIPLVSSDLTVSSKTPIPEICLLKVDDVLLRPSSDLHLVIANQALKKPRLLNQILTSVSDKGFVLSREAIDFQPENFDILLEHVTETEKLILFQKPKTTFPTVPSVKISWRDFDWLPKLQEILKKKQLVVVYGNGEEGVLGLLNCIRLERGCEKVRCFFMMDEAPEFDLQIPFYQQQMKKNLAVNIYKHGTWGTYRHLPLGPPKEVISEHCYVRTVKWVAGPLRIQEPPVDKILISPYYTAINYKDVATTTGRVNLDGYYKNRLLPTSFQGYEFSGRDQNGRRVMGVTENFAIATLVAAIPNNLIEIPNEWSLEDAATVLVAYKSILHPLIKLGKLRTGSSVLIHSAADSISLAAIHICLYYSCKIYLTVETKRERRFIKKHFSRIPDTCISDTQHFEEMIKTQTRNVQVVINFSKETLEPSLGCLVPGGHLLDFLSLNQVKNEPLVIQKQVTYHGISADSSELSEWSRKKILEGIKMGYVRPIPRRVFEKKEVEGAFKFMARSRIAKVLIKIREEENQEIVCPKKLTFTGISSFYGHPDKTYVIVGGLGGFGLELADWLFLKGARKLVLVNKSGVTSEYQNYRIQNWESFGAIVKISKNDVTTKQGSIDLIKDAKNLGPVDAIFNLAAVLKDCMFEDQTTETFEVTLKPKVAITKNLDVVSRQECPDLRYFVVFSSLACGVGNGGQTNYGMSNSVCERICERRTKDGFPALAIQWGPIGDVGHVARLQKNNKELVIRGTLQQRISNCLETLDVLLHQEDTVVSSMVVAPKNKKSSTKESAVTAVLSILGIKNIKEVNPYIPLAEMGLDSMTGVEIIQLLEKDFEIFLSVRDIRTLTFARLSQIEIEQKNSDTNSKKTKKLTGNTFIQYLPERSALSLVKLGSKISDGVKGKKVFILPGIEGVLQILEPLAKTLPHHVHGVTYNFKNPESTIESTARNILPMIEKHLSQNEDFTIVGYSFGSVVSAELVALLEQKGHQGTFIAIDGSPHYIKSWFDSNSLSQDDSKLHSFLVFNAMLLVLPVEIVKQNMDKINNCKTFDSKVEAAVDLMSIGINGDQAKESFQTMYTRCKALISYQFPHEKIKSKVYLFKAKYPFITDIGEDYQLGSFCENFVQSAAIEGDHISVVGQPELFDAVNKII